MPYDHPTAKETPSLRRHAAVVVEHGDLREEIDVQIAPLILETWKAGIQAMMSCQETDPGMAWIEFDSPEDMHEHPLSMPRSLGFGEKSRSGSIRDGVSVGIGFHLFDGPNVFRFNMTTAIKVSVTCSIVK